MVRGILESRFHGAGIVELRCVCAVELISPIATQQGGDRGGGVTRTGGANERGYPCTRTRARARRSVDWIAKEFSGVN